MGKKPKTIFPQEIINKKIFLRILAKKDICPKEEKKRFLPYMYKKNLASLKIPTTPPPPSLF